MWRLRPWLAFAGLAACYHGACWALAQRTLVERALGMRLAAYDGRPPNVGQVALRLLAGGRASATDLYLD